MPMTCCLLSAFFACHQSHHSYTDLSSHLLYFKLFLLAFTLPYVESDSTNSCVLLLLPTLCCEICPLLPGSSSLPILIAVFCPFYEYATINPFSPWALELLSVWGNYEKCCCGHSCTCLFMSTHAHFYWMYSRRS